MGGAVALSVLTSALGNKVAGAIIENTFTSISEMVDLMFPYLRFLKRLVLRNHWPSIDRIGRLQLPILFIMCTSGSDDSDAG